MSRIGDLARTHGLSQTPEYQTWRNMKRRVLDPANISYPDYGGRGITICDRWLDDVEAFVADMGPRPGPEYMIDRIDNDGPYSPENCQWATRSDQMKNRRQRTHCIRGHEFTPENTRLYQGGRYCRTCARERARRLRAERRPS